MAQNRENVKRFYDAYNRRDWAALEAMMDPDVEWFHAGRAELVRGSAAVLALFQSNAETFPDAQVDVNRVHCAGDYVIAECSLRKVGTRGAPTRAVFCDVERFVNGRCIRGSTYADTFRMLEQGLVAA